MRNPEDPEVAIPSPDGTITRTIHRLTPEARAGDPEVRSRTPNISFRLIYTGISVGISTAILYTAFDESVDEKISEALATTTIGPTTTTTSTTTEEDTTTSRPRPTITPAPETISFEVLGNRSN